MPLDLKSLVEPVSVRAAIGVEYNTTTLPDATIRARIYVNAAIRALKDTYSAIEDVSDADEIDAVTDALNYLVAAELLPSVPQFTTQKFQEGDAYTRQLQSVDDRVAALRDKAYSVLQDVAAIASQGSIPTFFDLACGRRGL